MGSKRIDAPKHLQAKTRRWWLAVVRDWALEQHHVRILTHACEAFDRAEEARKAIDKHGLTYTDRFNQPRSRPEVNIERDCRLQFCRLVRELALDENDAPDSRPPRTRGK